MAAYTNGVAEEGQLWRNCAKWMTYWGVLKPNDKCNSPSAEMLDFANALRDGVIICKLLDNICPGCIELDELSQKPTVAQYLCLKNINLFLKCCREKFGLQESDLFETHMLSDLTNFHQVLCTLSKISTSSKALKRIDVCSFSAPEVVSEEEENIYEYLRYREMSSAYDNILPEAIYESICPVSHNHELEAEPVREKRRCALKELVDTEKHYVDLLSASVEKFMACLREYMKPEDFHVVFFKIKNLFDIHLEFLCDLLKANSTNPFIKVSSIFLNRKCKFLIYGLYCANLTKAQKKLHELNNDDEIFHQVLMKCEMEYTKLKLVDILKFPLNRFLQYRLLLERIMQYTPPEHEEHGDLQKTMDAILELNEHINETKGDSDKLEEAATLQRFIREWNHGSTLCKLTSFGRLIKDDLVKIRTRDDDVLRSRNIFVFDTCILVCTRLHYFGSNQFAFRGMINIDEYYVRDDGLLNQFYLEERNRHMRYTIYARSNELKGQIMKAITEARAYIHPDLSQYIKLHRFQLASFNTPQQCASCSKYLSGIIYQGYKCDVCNLVVHRTCLATSESCGVPWNIKEKLWYVGEMDRVTATEKLRSRESGTFLIRIRPQNDGVNLFSLTLKNGECIHYIKIFCINETPKKYYLTRSIIFESLIEMVHYYQLYSLGKHFKKIPDEAKLVWPYRQLRAVVIKDYVAADILELSLLEGQSIKIIATDGYTRGFWKGRTESNEIGYFPMDAVKLVKGEVQSVDMESGYVS